jgi:hypothetical protein
MADTSDGIIYGLDKFKFNSKVFGYISEDGLAPGGDAPSTTKVRAAQLRNAVVKSLLTTPGSITFTFTLIQLKGENFKDVFGGTVDETTGVYSAPAIQQIQEAPAEIECASGHKLVFPKANLIGNFSGAVNLAQTLAISCTVEILTPDGGGSPWQSYPPGETVPEA